MSIEKNMMPEPDPGTATDAHAPRKLTFAQNVILTIKVLAGFGLLGVALWAVKLWTAAE
ncbi:MAG TPA: hypothetical protein VGF59_27935 [Bryobacteraceae bacterium]|jgi:hypothetical protein